MHAPTFCSSHGGNRGSENGHTQTGCACIYYPSSRLVCAAQHGGLALAVFETTNGLAHQWGALLTGVHNTMKHLVLGGTGTVGSEVVRWLVAAGQTVRVATRSADKLKTLPGGVEGVIGDTTDPKTYKIMFEGADTLFLLNPVAMSELHEGLASVHEAKRFGIKRLVYLSVHKADWGPHIPHFASKLGVETAIKESGIPYTILRPNNFHQNDFWFKDAIVQYGIYPQPIGDIGLSRIDVRDIGEVAVRALVKGDLENRTIPLVGPDVLTGEATAKIWSDALGREVKYMGNDLDVWEQEALKMLPPWLAYDFKIMYKMFQERGLTATDQDLKDQDAALGHPPRSFAAFAAEVAPSWK